MNTGVGRRSALTSDAVFAGGVGLVASPRTRILVPTRCEQAVNGSSPARELLVSAPLARQVERFTL